MYKCGRWTMIDSSKPGPSVSVIPTNTINWEPHSGGEVPHNAVVGGRGLNGEAVYIGRTRLRENSNELTPGIVVPNERCLLVSYGTGVRKARDYEVLVSSDEDTIHWVACTGGNVPSNAVIGGIDCSYLEPLYIGRTRGDLSRGRTWRGQRIPLPDDGQLNDLKIPGKVHRTHKCLYIPFLEKEYLFREYEVLALKESPTSLAAACKAAIWRHLGSNVGHTGDDHDEVTETIVAGLVDRLPLPEKLKEFCSNISNI